MPHIGPLTKGIPPKLFLDMAPSFSEDVTRAMKTTFSKMAGTSLYILISFHSRDVLCTCNRLCDRPGSRLFCARLTVHYLAVYSVLASF